MTRLVDWWRRTFRANEQAWRVRYPDGTRTVRVRRGTALALAAIYGGRIEWDHWEASA